MTNIKGGALAAAACIGLAACNFGFNSAAPTGQVVAKVGDREVTLSELREEMGSATFPDPRARKAAETQALRNIVARIVLADQARHDGLDKTPTFAMQKARLVDNLLVQALQQKSVSTVIQPTKEEVQNFIAANPDIFAERKIFAVDQIRMPRLADQQILNALRPLKTLEAIEGVLKENRIAYQRSSGTLDAVGADPRLIQAIVKLPPNEVFVFPAGQGLLVNQVKDVKIVPYGGDQAEAYAEKLLARQRTQEVLTRSFQSIMTKAAPTVKYNKDYEPPAAPTAPKAAK